MVGDDVASSARRFVLASVGFLIAFQLGALLGIGRRPAVVLGLNGFVLHMVFGKAYTLVPSYFARELKVVRPMDVHLVATVGGTAALASADLLDLPADVTALGGLAWLFGVVVFVVTLGWAVRDNLAGGETGTGDHNANRRPIDRAANAFVPLAGAYLLLGSWELAAGAAGLPTAFDGFAPRASHLLAAGAATLLVFAIGFRLLPRFFVADPPAGLVWVVLLAGAVGPALVAGGLPAGPVLLLGAAVEAVAILAFGAAVVVLFRRSDRRRVGFYSVLLGVAGGALGVLLGLSFAVADRPPALVTAHYRLNLLGFLGLVIVGIAYQFYPPGAGTFRGASDRTAMWSIAGLAGGLAVEVGGLGAGDPAVAAAGRAIGLAGALGYAWLVTGVFRERFGGARDGRRPGVFARPWESGCMETVTVTRHIDAPLSAVEALVADVEAFMAAGGFDEVERVDDRTLRIARHLGLGRIELRLDLVDDPEAALAYRQREGIFEEMTTRYTLEAAGGGVEVSATTEFAVGGLVGRVLDATVIRRQRRRELEAQFDYLESAAGDD